MKKKLILAHLAMFTVAFFYASNFTIAKDVMPKYIQPSGFIVLRVTAASILFWIFHTLFVREKTEKKDLFKLALCGVFGVAVNQLFFFEGLNLTTPIHGALIMLVTPILVLLFSFFVLKEQVTLFKVLGIAVGMFGASVLILGGGSINVADAPNPMLGDLFIAINAASYAIYLILIKPLMLKYHPVTILKWVFSFGWLYVLPFGFEQVTVIDWGIFEWDTYLRLAYILVCVTFLAYLLNASALAVVNPSVVSTYIYLQPLLATLIAIPVRGDELTTSTLIAGAFIFVGVYLVSYRPKANPNIKTA